MEAARTQLNVGEFEDAEKLYGINYAPHGVLFDAELRELIPPQSTNREDAMHVFFSNGIAGKEVSFFLRALMGVGVYFPIIKAWLQASWEIPKCIGNPGCLTRSFTPGKERHFVDTGDLSMSASECLTIVAALGLFLLEHKI